MDDPAEYYREILGGERGASPEEVRRAYRRLVKIWHPDLVRSDPSRKAAAEERKKEINEVYKRLCYHSHGTANPRPTSGAAGRPGPQIGKSREW